MLWSHTGLEPFHPWPANSWELHDTVENNETPLRTSGLFGDTFFVTVEKEGYVRPLPQPVELYGFRKEKLHFDLVLSPEAYAENMREKGYVLFGGEWVDPEEKDLAQYKGIWMEADQARRLEQLSRGLVEYNGGWMTPDEARARERAERKAAGFVLWKGRWARPEAVEEERAIDNETAALAEKTIYTNLSPPDVIMQTGLDAAQVRLRNISEEPVRFLFSGDISREFIVPAGGILGIDDRIALPAGRYKIAIIPPDKDNSLYGEWPLAAGVVLGFNYNPITEEE